MRRAPTVRQQGSRKSDGRPSPDVLTIMLDDDEAVSTRLAVLGLALGFHALVWVRATCVGPDDVVARVDLALGVALAVAVALGDSALRPPGLLAGATVVTPLVAVGCLPWRWLLRCIAPGSWFWEVWTACIGVWFTQAAVVAFATDARTDGRALLAQLPLSPAAFADPWPHALWALGVLGAGVWQLVCRRRLRGHAYAPVS